MTFKETLTYLEELAEFRMRLDLDPISRLLEIFGRPDRGLKSVIIAGTNGKGSTCAFLTSMARAAGTRVGTFTSPHLESVTERIALDGEPMSEDRFAKLATAARVKIESTDFGRPTYFEFLTILACLAFREAHVDLAIFEVGLGGRLDATNALERIAVAITPIDYDHMAILGSTLTEIAREKGAILRPNLPAVISPQTLEARAALEKMCDEIAPRAFWLTAHTSTTANTPGSNEGPGLHQALGLRGAHQAVNADTATALARELRTLGFPFTEEAIARGLREARNPGRLELWEKGGRQVWLDVAHNPHSARALALFLAAEKTPPIQLLIGMLGDKEWRPVLEALLPYAASVTFTMPVSPRAWNVEEAARAFPSAKVIKNPLEALPILLEKPDPILCTGSFYLVGAVRKELRREGFAIKD